VTNQRPACTTSPPPSSSTSQAGSNQRLNTSWREPSLSTRGSIRSAWTSFRRAESITTSSGASLRAQRRERGAERRDLRVPAGPLARRELPRAEPPVVVLRARQS